jgi:hypothetical protein
MRPDGLSVLSMSISMQPLPGLGTSVGEFGVVKLNTVESAIKSHLLITPGSGVNIVSWRRLSPHEDTRTQGRTKKNRRAFISSVSCCETHLNTLLHHYRNHLLVDTSRRRFLYFRQCVFSPLTSEPRE